MKCHMKGDGYTSINQWKKKGYIIRDDVKPTELWNNRYCTYVTEFCRENEVRRMTYDELSVYRSEINESQRNAYKKRRKEELAERYRENIYEKMNVNLIDINEVDLTVNPENVIVFDVETTGLSFENDEILQISICNGNGKILMNQYFRPERHFSWGEAEKINGISARMVEDKPGIKEYVEEIQEIIDSAKLILTYNGAFDRSFLAAAGVVFKGQNEVDVMVEFANIYGEWCDWCGYKWQKLTTAASYYNFIYGDMKEHDSYTDVLVTLFVFKKIIKSKRGGTNEDKGY